MRISGVKKQQPYHLLAAVDRSGIRAGLRSILHVLRFRASRARLRNYVLTNEEKVAIFRKGNTSCRASSGGYLTKPQAPSRQTTTSNNNKKKKEANGDTGFVNANTICGNVQLPRGSHGIASYQDAD